MSERPVFMSQVLAEPYSFEWKCEINGKIALFYGKKLILSIREKSYNDIPAWKVEFPVIDMYSTIVAGSVEEAKWRAVLLLQDECNKVIHKYMHVRDHLPDVRELYEDCMKAVSQSPIQPESQSGAAHEEV